MFVKRGSTVYRHPSKSPWSQLSAKLYLGYRALNYSVKNVYGTSITLAPTTYLLCIPWVCHADKVEIDWQSKHTIECRIKAWFTSLPTVFFLLKYSHAVTIFCDNLPVCLYPLSFWIRCYSSGILGCSLDIVKSILIYQVIRRKCIQVRRPIDYFVQVPIYPYAVKCHNS